MSSAHVFHDEAINVYLALGLQSCLWRLFGSVPGPTVLCVVFDSASLFWQRDCGHRGNGWVYDTSALGMRGAVLAVGSMLEYVSKCSRVFVCVNVLLPTEAQHNKASTLYNDTELG